MSKEAIEGIGSDYASRENRPKPQTYESYDSMYHVAENGSKTATTAPVVKKENAGEGKQGESQEERAKEERERVASEASIKEATNRANRSMERTRCEYSYHKETKRVSIKVIDKDTDKVIREIPPEKSLDMLQKMWEMAGILVDEKR